MPISWKSYFGSWTDALRQAGHDPAQLVRDKHIQRRPDLPDNHPYNAPGQVLRPSRGTCEWWPADPVEQMDRHVEIQLHFHQYPKSPGPLRDDFGVVQAHRDTAAALRRAHGDPQRIAAIMLNAALHRSQWNGAHQIPLRLRLALKTMIPEPLRRHLMVYHHASPSGLPEPFVLQDDGLGGTYEEPVELDLSGRTAPTRAVIDALIAYQIAVLRTEQPVMVIFDGVRDVAVRAEVDRRVAEIQDAAAAGRQRAQAHAQARQQAEDALDAAHPRRRDWPHLDAGELTRCVWSKPTRALATDFGVSDVAIAKKCRQLGVTKPPRGFWAKVRAGQLPHPDGTPTDTTG